MASGSPANHGADSDGEPSGPSTGGAAGSSASAATPASGAPTAKKGDKVPPPSAAKKGDKVLPPAAKKKRKGGTPTVAKEPGTTSAGGRYTAPIPAERKGPSPRWVPVLMFGLWGVGLGMIILNYMGSLPGSGDGGNGYYLVGGLALILGGIITATQYR
jgi:hypothetical protein